MPSRFLNNITVNDEYTLPSADGTADQIITTDGAGQLSFVDQSTLNSGSAERTEILVKNLEGSALSKGDPVYIIGSVGASERLQVGLANAGDATKMPCVGLLTQDLAINGEGTAIVTGKLKNLITSPIDGATPTENDTIYVKSGGGLTLTKPTGSTNLIQNVGQVGRVSTSSDGNIVVSAILRSNDVPNLPTGRIWVGDGNTTTSGVVYLNETTNQLGINTTTTDGTVSIESPVGAGFGLFTKTAGINNWSGLYQDGSSNWTSVLRNGSGTQTVQLNSSGNSYLNGGNVGIGTTSPSYELTVKGSSPTNTIEIESSSEGNTALQFNNDGGGGSGSSGGNSYINFGAYNIFPLSDDLDRGQIRYSHSSNFMAFTVGATERMRINSSGNVGIGTTSPSSKLTIGSLSLNSVGGLKIEDPSNTAYGANFSFNDSDTAVEIGGITNNVLNDCISIARDATRTITITSSQRVGIIETNPTQKLHVDGNARVTGAYYDSNNAPGTSGQILSSTETGTNWISGSAIPGVPDGSGTTNYLARWTDADTLGIGTTYDNGTNVGIGETNPGQKLQVKGNIYAKDTNYCEIGVDQTDSAAIRMGISSGSANTFIDASNTGAGHAGGTPVIRLLFNVSEKFRFTGQGNLGIGTTSPNAKLDIRDGELHFTSSSLNSNPSGRIRFNEYGSGSNVSGAYIEYNGASNYFSMFTNTEAVDYEFIRALRGSHLLLQPSSGNVGIGTTSPSDRLEVAAANSQLRLTDTDDSKFTQFSYSSGKLVVRNNSTTTTTNQFTLDLDGKMGIGTTSPQAKTHVFNSIVEDGLIVENSSTSFVDSAIFANNTSTTNGNLLRLRSSGSDKMVVLGNGNVGIGTTSPEAILHINGTEDTTYWGPLIKSTSTNPARLTFTNTEGSGFIDQNDNALRFYHNGNYRMLINSSGNVGIGTTSPQEKLHVYNGSAYITPIAYAPSQNDWVIRAGAYNNTAFDQGLKLKSTSGGTSYMAFETAHSGGETMVLRSGNVGIGMDSPSYKLDVAGAARVKDAANPLIYFGRTNTVNSGIGMTSDTLLRFAVGTAGLGTDTKMVINSSGNVGIGTTSPSQKLHVSSSDQSSARIRLSNTNTGSGGDNIEFVAGIHNTTQDGFSIYNASSDQTQLVIRGDGNVGIGTSNPGERLSIQPGADVSAEIGEAHVGMVGFTGYAGFSHIDRNSAANYALLQHSNGLTYLNGSAGQGIRFRVNNVDKMILTSGGNFGVGTTSPGEKLTVKGTDQYIAVEQTTYPWGGTNTLGLRMGTNGVSGLLDWRRWTGSGTDHGTAVIAQVNSDGGYGLDFRVNNQSTNTPATTSRMFLSSSGEVGIGTTSPTHSLHVAGTGYFGNYVYLAGTGNSIGNYYGNTDIQTAFSVLVRSGTTYKPIQASAFTVSSDYRLKSNITPLENAIDRLNQLNVHRFNWNDRLDEPKVDGFIAHEVSPIIPEAVLGEKDEVYEDGTPKHQGIDQAKIVPLLTAALQEAILKIEQLETRIQTLENN